MLIERSQIPERYRTAALEALLKSTQAHERRISFIVVSELHHGSLLYQTRRPMIFAPFGSSEIMKLYPSIEEAESQTQIYGATRVALWVNDAIVSLLPTILGSVMPASAVGELIFELTGSNSQAQDAEAAAETARREESTRRWRRDETGRRRRRRRR